MKVEARLGVRLRWMGHKGIFVHLMMVHLLPRKGNRGSFPHCYLIEEIEITLFPELEEGGCCLAFEILMKKSSIETRPTGNPTSKYT